MLIFTRSMDPSSIVGAKKTISDGSFYSLDGSSSIAGAKRTISNADFLLAQWSFQHRQS